MKYYTMKDLVTLLGVTKNTIINWEKTGKIASPKREDIFEYRYWTESEVKEMEKLSKEIKGRILEDYRKHKIYVYCPKEGCWKYRILYHIYTKSETKTKMTEYKDDSATKEEALEKAKRAIDKRIRESEGR